LLFFHFFFKQRQLTSGVFAHGGINPADNATRVSFSVGDLLSLATILESFYRKYNFFNTCRRVAAE
jgi:hypothetical protein